MQSEGSSMLVSILFASNRPKNMLEFFDNIEEMTADFSCLEILIKIDIEDPESKSFLDKQIKKRPFTIKYICTPRLGGYYDLWIGYNELWENTSREAYFIWPINDELRIKTKNWDQAISRYVVLFPDHVFRLRVSQFKFRNYFRLWECFFAPDNYTIFTRRWIELVGGFGDCHGMDAYAQAVAFYLWKLDKWKQISRDVPILDLELEGEEANVGDTDDEHENKSKGVLTAWLTLASYEQRLNYKRQARTIQAYIEAHRMGISAFTIAYDAKLKSILLYDENKQAITRLYDARVSRIFSFLKTASYRIENKPGINYLFKIYSDDSVGPVKKIIVTFVISIAIIIMPNNEKAMKSIVKLRNDIGKFVGYVSYGKNKKKNVIGIIVEQVKKILFSSLPSSRKDKIELSCIVGSDHLYKFDSDSNKNIEYSEDRIFPIPNEAKETQLIMDISPEK